MAELVLFGVPNGQQISATDNQDAKAFLGLMYDGISRGIKTKVVRRANNDVHYVFAVYENQGNNFCDYNGRPGSHFGMSLIFHNRYIPDSDKVFKLLRAVYDNYVKNQIIKEEPNGLRKWMRPALATPRDEITTYVANGMNNLIKNHPEFNFTRMVQPLPPIQKQTER